MIRAAQGVVHFRIRVPRYVPPAFEYFGVDSPLNRHGLDVVGIAYDDPRRHGVLSVNEYGPGISPPIGDPVSGILVVNGRRWTVYGHNFALTHTFADGVTVEIEGDGLLPTRTLGKIAAGIP